MSLRCSTMLYIVFAPLFLSHLGALASLAPATIDAGIATQMLLTCQISLSLEQCSIVLNMNAASLRFFAARTENPIDWLGSVRNLSLGHPLVLWPLSDWKFFDNGWWQTCCSLGATYGQCSFGYIFLLLFVGFTWRLLVLFFNIVITVCVSRDFLSVSSASLSLWWAHKVHTYSWSWPHLFYQLCKRGTSSNIPSNTNCTCRVGLATMICHQNDHHIICCLQGCTLWQKQLLPCFLQWLRSLGLIN